MVVDSGAAEIREKAFAAYLRRLAEHIEARGLRQDAESSLSIDAPCVPVDDPAAAVQGYESTGELVITLRLWLNKEKR